MKFLFTILLFLSFSFNANAQAYLKAEYIGSSSYKDIDNNKTGGKGDAKIISGGVQIPLSMKMNENNRPIVWGIGLGGSYTSFNNRNIPTDLCPEEILNAQLSLMHMRPISEKWSIIASLGAGVYTAHADLSKIRMKSVLAHGGVIFIWHLRDNLDVGMGLAINNSFGYPMAFPAFYLNWELHGRYEVKVSMVDAVSVSAGIKLKDYFKLNLVAEMNGSLALEKINGEEKMFSHQYIVTGIQPEFTIGKSLSIPITAGIVADRPAFYEKRSLKSFFKAMNREHDPHFTVAPYVSVGLKYRF
ncbi:MAG: DUF6268 family outer membrane beta-barrel protein [Dysgonomonas sp.]